MKAVILAAGKGTRLAPLTDDLPKTLLPLTPRLRIIDRVLSSLPKKVTEAVIVTGLFGNKIEEYVGSEHSGKRIQYVSSENNLEYKGTYGALKAAERLLGKEPFLVLGADDIVLDFHDTETLCEHECAFGIHAITPPSQKYIEILVDNEGNVAGKALVSTLDKKIALATGYYVLDCRIFDCKPVYLEHKKEYLLPQTILENLDTLGPVRAVDMPSWQSVNTPEEFEAVQNIFKNKQ